MPLNERPRSSLRARRKRTRALIALAFLSALGVAAFGISSLSYYPRLNISQMVVTGAENIRPELIRAYLETQIYSGSYNFLSRANIFLYQRAELERALVAFFPRIKRVSISRGALLAQALSVRIEERQPFARWCLSTVSGQVAPCFLMDNEGYIFASLGSTTTRYISSYTFEGDVQEANPIGKTYLRGRLSGVLAVLEKLGQAGFTPQRITMENEQDFSVRLEGGLLLRLSFGGDVNGLIRNLGLVLDSDALTGKRGQVEYIDLRFGNRVYYKLKGASAEGKLQNE